MLKIVRNSLENGHKYTSNVLQWIDTKTFNPSIIYSTVIYQCENQICDIKMCFISVLD